MNPSLITEPELMDWLSCRRRATLERLLREHGVRILHGQKGQICTTLEAINASLGLERKQGETVEFDL